jgi:hypothetical protein
MVRFAASMTMFAVAVSALCTTAHGQLAVDQQQTMTFYSFPIDKWGQSFTPTKPWLYALDLEFADGGIYNVRIKDLGGGYDGPVIGESGLMTLSAGLQHITFPVPIATTPGHLYDISVVDDTPLLDGDQGVRGVAGDPYPGGAAHFPGSANDSQVGNDWYFVTYVPEPSSVTALAAVALVARRVSDRRSGAPRSQRKF